MSDICLVIAYNRPEYLKICLEHIQQAKDADKLTYLFALDTGYDKKNLDIINDFPFNKKITVPQSFRLKLAKQSYNVINGMLNACNLTDELIYYIEDDVFIGKDFFTFTKEIHKNEPDIFCSILSKNVNSNDNTINDSDSYYIKTSIDYQGIGSCYKAKTLKELLQPHFKLDYFTEPIKYVVQNFPDSVLNRNFAEQDGLIRRIIEKNKLQVAFSHIPRCFHAGFYGYNRFPKIKYERMNLQQRYELIKKYAYDESLLRQISQGENYVLDSLPVNLETSHKECKMVNLK